MFAVASRLGRTVSELEHSMSSAEFTEWMGYLQYEAGWRVDDDGELIPPPKPKGR